MTLCAASVPEDQSGCANSARVKIPVPAPILIECDSGESKEKMVISAIEMSYVAHGAVLDEDHSQFAVQWRGGDQAG